MPRIFIFPLILGLGGAVVLIALGIWQMQRLAWKEAILSEISMRIDAPNVSLPATPTETNDEYLSVKVAGNVSGPELHVLTSMKPEGPGFRVLRSLITDQGRRLIVDLGYLPEADKDAPRPAFQTTIEGNLLWPDETDGFTPDPNLDRNIWFARNTIPMAEALKTEPILIVARNSTTETGLRPLPVTVNISNDHLEYAITWFSLAVVWIGMTGYLLWRIRNARR